MTAPDDLIRRDTAERAIRARQRDTEDSGIYAGLSVALQELAALPADPVAEAAVAIVEHLFKFGVTSGDTEANRLCAAYRAAVAARSAGTVPPAQAPAPACARCGGSGIAYDDGGGMERTSVTIPCPECRGKP